ncbi:MAG: class I SAM-dependent methyltransferase [Patescibacteria group bacterium]
MKSINCNLCGGNQSTLYTKTHDLLYKTTQNSFTLVTCNRCGFAYLNPQPEPFEMNNFYPDNYRPHQTKTVDGRVYTLPKESTRRVLDVGCGWGDLLLELAQKYPTWALYGVDFDERAVHQAQQYGFPVSYGSVNDAKYENDFFDEIYMNHVLEHVHDPSSMIKEINRILKPGGTLHVLIPNFRSLSRMLFRQYWYHIDSPRHLYHFTPRTLTRMLKENGFAEVHTSFVPSPKYFLQSLSLWRSGKKRKWPRAIWRLFTLPAHAISWLGLSSTMNATGKK